MGEDDGLLPDEILAYFGLIADDLREEIRQGVRRIFDNVVAKEVPPASIPPLVKVEIPVTKEELPSR